MGMWTILKKNIKFSDAELDDSFLKVSAAVKARPRRSLIMALEMAKPVSFLGYTSLVVFAPILELIFDPVKMEKLQAIFSDRNRIEMLIKSIENLEISEKEKTKEGESSEQN